MTWIGMKLLKRFVRPNKQAIELKGSDLIRVIREIERKKARRDASTTGQGEKMQ